EPPPRDTVSLSQMAMSRLGKDVVDLLDVSVEFPVVDPSHSSGVTTKTVLRDVEWRIAPGERTGILGVNGAGKSTLLGLITGTVKPTAGTVRRGKTVKVADLTQRLGDLEEHMREPVRVIIE